jgi:hypothetical protein
MIVSAAKLFSPHINDTRKERVLRLACALFLVGACVAVARSTPSSITGATTSLTATYSVHGRKLPTSSPSANAVAAAYARQRVAGDQLLECMRAAPDAWQHGYYHALTRAVWVDPFRDFHRCPGVVCKLCCKLCCLSDREQLRNDCAIGKNWGMIAIVAIPSAFVSFASRISSSYVPYND